MPEPEHDVIGIGNAIVDVMARHDDSFLSANGLLKGSMQLVDEAGALSLYDKLGPAMEISGGSAANTIAGLTSLGGAARYVGKVADDLLGAVFIHDIRAAGVSYDTQALAGGPQTARCMVVVTPDGQRTMSTYLGASALLGPDDIVEEQIANAGITYLEGYLWDRPEAKDAFRKAAGLATRNGRKVALTLSDSFCVDRHRDSFLSLIRDGVDVLFANEAELLSLYQTSDFDEAVRQVKADCHIAAVTRSEKGSVIVNGNDAIAVEAVAIDKGVDTTGAGDLYAAGFMFGLARGKPLAECAHIGHVAAAEIISHMGARPVAKLSTLI
ncbi:MAG: adenosine kinase [Anderseniella sp.]|jgi:sugar/nucleoside kinase (ribokinase family)|nr:adenosine kinase [Anderseniella sp.]